jgi:hypothetical protein
MSSCEWVGGGGRGAMWGEGGGADRGREGGKGRALTV